MKKIIVVVSNKNTIIKCYIWVYLCSAVQISCYNGFYNEDLLNPTEIEMTSPLKFKWKAQWNGIMVVRVDIHN